MLKRGSAVGAGVVLALGGVTAAGKWHEHRVAVCAQRGAVLAAIDLFRRHPDGFRLDEPYSGCDSESVVAFAGWRFASTGGPTGDALADRVVVDVDERAVTDFYRQVLRSAGWQISGRTPAPSADAAALCASTTLRSGKTHVTLSFLDDGAYEVLVSDSVEAGPRCV
jgi:hypothetical protein